jgi:hypothetical protein
MLKLFHDHHFLLDSILFFTIDKYSHIIPKRNLVHLLGDHLYTKETVVVPESTPAVPRIYLSEG